jgi:N-acetylmuramoyl-L-alanine amidase
MKICIDAGHGGTDPGAIGTQPFRLEEKDFNLRLALLLEEELEAKGHWTIVTRRQDRSLSLPARADFSNRLGAELFVSIHANAAGMPAVEGMEIYHFPGSEKGQRVATLTNPAQLEFLADPQNQRSLASTISDGINAFG